MKYNMDSVLELNLSWMEEEKRLLSIDQLSIQEIIPSINMRFIYIDTSGNIEKIDGEKIELDIISNKSVLSKTKLLDILRKRKKIKYIYSDSLLFHVDLYANQMQYSDYSSFLNKITIFDDIIFNPSIFVFHSLSTIYVFYKKKYNSILNKTRKNITPEIR